MTSFLELLPTSPALLALGEPEHGDPAHPRRRNRTFASLTERGFRSIAVESDRAAGLLADAYVQGSDAVTLDRALAEGFSHGFGGNPGNRELLRWMREWNTTKPESERLTFHGFDPPLELESVSSPRRYLHRVSEFLGHDTAEIDDRIGDEARWSDPAAIWEPGRSVGRSADAQRLRVIADDLLAELYRRAYRRPDGWSAAQVWATSAVAVLRYHAEAAVPRSRAEQFAHLAGVRAGLMAENLLAIHAHEAHRGSTLVFAHDVHLQRQPTTMTVAGQEVTWHGAGAILGALLGDRYAVLS